MREKKNGLIGTYEALGTLIGRLVGDKQAA
jgi:hypothetical protein